MYGATVTPVSRVIYKPNPSSRGTARAAFLSSINSGRLHVSMRLFRRVGRTINSEFGGFVNSTYQSINQPTITCFRRWATCLSHVSQGGDEATVRVYMYCRSLQDVAVLAVRWSSLLFLAERTEPMRHMHTLHPATANILTRRS